MGMIGIALLQEWNNNKYSTDILAYICIYVILTIAKNQLRISIMVSNITYSEWYYHDRDCSPVNNNYYYIVFMLSL